MKSNTVFKFAATLTTFAILGQATQPVSAISVISSHTSKLGKQTVQQLLINPYPCYFGGCQVLYIQAVGSEQQAITIGSIVAFGSK